MMRISKIPLPEEVKEQLLAREYLLTVPFVVLGIVLVIVARLIDMDMFVLLRWAAALLASCGLYMVSGRSRRAVAAILAGLSVFFLAIEFAGYREVASFLIAGGAGVTMLYANVLGRRDFVRDFRKQQSESEDENGG